jgi:N-acetyl-anhydromuramyl-L-alanine amidase AmpD
MAVRKRPVRGVYRPVVQMNLNPLFADEVKGRIQPRIVVLHTTESHDAPGLADVKGVAGFLDRHSQDLAIHLIVDEEGNSAAFLERAGKDGGHLAPVKFFHAGGVNGYSIGIEQIGFAKTPLAGWWRRPKQLLKVARWLAYCHAHFGIPLVHSTTHGVCRHVDVSGPGGHWDPGPGYPFRFVLTLARACAKFGWTSGGVLAARR